MAEHIKVQLIAKNYNLMLPDSPMNWADWIDCLDTNVSEKLAGHLLNDFREFIDIPAGDCSAKKYCKKCLSKLESLFLEWIDGNSSFELLDYKIAMNCNEKNEPWHWTKQHQKLWDFRSYKNLGSIKAIPFIANSSDTFCSDYLKKKIEDIFAEATNLAKSEKLIEQIEESKKLLGNEITFNSELNALKNLRKKNTDDGSNMKPIVDAINSQRKNLSAKEYKQKAPLLDEIQKSLENAKKELPDYEPSKHSLAPGH